LKTIGYSLLLIAAGVLTGQGQKLQLIDDNGAGGEI
jgi:hypothetical protein